MPVWLWILIGVGALFLIWMLLNLKSSRAEGVVIKPLHKYRKMMFYLMQRRTESMVNYDAYARADKLLEYLEATKKVGFDCDVTHCLVGAALIGLLENPRMNRFVAGRRLYQRKGQSVTFTMKRVRMDNTAKIAAARIDQKPGETFRQLSERMGERIGVERSGKKTYSDKELDLFLLLPRPVMNLAVKLVTWLDYHNLLPGGFVNNDPFYVSMYIANLGSLGMRAGFHHLYEYGNCPLFMMAGEIEEQPVVENGQVVPRKMLHMRWTFDERIDDGLNCHLGMEAMRRALEDPFGYLGCLKEDGSDAWDLRTPRSERDGASKDNSASAA
jgi:hypothetical protein